MKRRSCLRYGRIFAFQWLWLFPLAFYLLQALLDRRRDWGEWYARRLFPLLAWPFHAISSALPLSFLFVSALLLPLALAALFVALVRVFLDKKQRGKRLRRLLFWPALTLSLAYCLYMLLHGLNFCRLPLAQNLALDVRPRSREELFGNCLWLADQAARERRSLPSDEAGLLKLDETRGWYLRQAQGNGVGLLAGSRTLPKAVPFSRYWSYTNTTGMYFPFWVEANVNADIQADEFLFTALHEIAHTRGFAREDEANFLAFYAGLSHDLPVFRYAAYESAFIYCYNRLYDEDQALAGKAWAALSKETAADIEARSVYWARFKGPVEEFSTQVNDGFLRANRQAEGVKSYGQVVDLILAYRASLSAPLAPEQISGRAAPAVARRAS